MSALHIDLEDDVRFRLQARATDCGYPNVEAYVQAMLLADAAGPAVNDAELEDLLLSRLDGPLVDVDANDFERMRQKLKDQLSIRPNAESNP